MNRAAGYTLAMKLIYAFAVWLIMGALIGSGLLMAVNGSPWLLLASVLGFIIAVGKIGCLSH
jgi:hypothetical protein